ncbi:unnamed protein product [Orchesella dallaii]|uniref:Linalool dehydratase/isomerase domain-containing protein n=1 Tax=Orchesella dallaii TaxID=48710 RepID=A0ABP1RQQ1_9HEXA
METIKNIFKRVLISVPFIVVYGIYVRFGGYKFIEITSENYNLTTFSTCKTLPEPHNYHSHPEHFPRSSSSLIGELTEFTENKLTEVLQSTEFPKRTYASSSGFVKTVLKAYSRHHNLVIRPDDIWAAIMIQFSFYMNKNAEKLRNKFVDFEGKRELSITGGSIYTVPYSLFVKLMTREIDRNFVDSKVKEWIMPNFTTTTQNDYVSIGVVLMATMKHYFDYEFQISCGIPNITLDGTVEDWKKILGRLEKLKEYELETWHDMLYPIISKFVDVKEGRVDGWFWEGIVSVKPGDPGGHPPYLITGWITAFCAFDKEGNWQGSKETDEETDMFGRITNFWHSVTSEGLEMGFDKIPRGVVEVDVTLNDHGKKYQSLMLAGHMAVNVKEDGVTMQPALGWAIALKP